MTASQPHAASSSSTPRADEAPPPVAPLSDHETPTTPAHSSSAGVRIVAEQECAWEATERDRRRGDGVKAGDEVARSSPFLNRPVSKYSWFFLFMFEY